MLTDTDIVDGAWGGGGLGGGAGGRGGKKTDWDLTKPLPLTVNCLTPQVGGGSGYAVIVRVKCIALGALPDTDRP